MYLKLVLLFMFVLLTSCGGKKYYYAVKEKVNNGYIMCKIDSYRKFISSNNRDLDALCNNFYYPGKVNSTGDLYNYEENLFFIENIDDVFVPQKNPKLFLLKEGYKLEKRGEYKYGSGKQQKIDREAEVFRIVKEDEE